MVFGYVFYDGKSQTEMYHTKEHLSNGLDREGFILDLNTTFAALRKPLATERKCAEEQELG